MGPNMGNQNNNNNILNYDINNQNSQRGNSTE
jgi:hypothetical protein